MEALSIFTYLISGALLLVASYIIYRRYNSGKVVCIIFNKKRAIYRKAVRPTLEGILNIGEGSYYFTEAQVFYTHHFLLREATPALIFEEGSPDPIVLYEHTQDSIISSAELSKIMNDRTVGEFVAAQSGVNVQRLWMTVVVMGVVTMLVVLISSYFTLDALGVFPDLSEVRR